MAWLFEWPFLNFLLFFVYSESGRYLECCLVLSLLGGVPCLKQRNLCLEAFTLASDGFHLRLQSVIGGFQAANLSLQTQNPSVKFFVSFLTVCCPNLPQLIRFIFKEEEKRKRRRRRGKKKKKRKARVATEL